MTELAKQHEIKAAHAVFWHCSATATAANPHERGGSCSPCLLGSAAMCGNACTGSIGRSAVAVDRSLPQRGRDARSVSAVVCRVPGRTACWSAMLVSYPLGGGSRWLCNRQCRTRRGGRSGRPAAPGEAARRARPRSSSRSGPCSGWPRSIGCGVGADRGERTGAGGVGSPRPGPGTPGRRGRGCRRPRLGGMTCGSGASAGAAQQRCGPAELAPAQASRAPRRAARCVQSRVVSVGRPAADRSARRSARPPNLRARLRGSASWPP